MAPVKNVKKGSGQGHFGALDGRNSSKMAKDTNFKFGKHAPRQCPDVTGLLEKILEKGAWPRSRDAVLGGDIHSNINLHTHNTHIKHLITYLPTYPSSCTGFFYC